MKKLKKLFSPSAFTATVASGLLLHSAVVAFAGDCISVSTGFDSCAGNYPTYCIIPMFGDKHYCCPYMWTCSGVNQEVTLGYCCPP